MSLRTTVILPYQLRVACVDALSVFFTVLLPSVLFVLFGLIFGLGEGTNNEYAAYVLPGMVGVMCSSDGLYTVGPMVRAYITQGILREFTSLPGWTGSLFLGFILTRLVFVMLSMVCLVALSGLLFSYIPGGVDLVRIFLGAALCFGAYALIAVGVALLANSGAGDYGFSSVYYFLGMFLCDAFFVLSERNLTLTTIAYMFPLKPVLVFMRGDDVDGLLVIVAWLAGGLTFLLCVLRWKTIVAPGRGR